MKYLIALIFPVLILADPLSQEVLNKKLTSLERAIIEDNYEEVNSKLKNGVSPNKKDTRYGFPLYFAVANNNIGIAHLLLKHGAQINAQLFNGISALHWAVFHNQVDMVEFLLQNKANPNIRVNGALPIELAREAQFFEIEAILKKY